MPILFQPVMFDGRVMIDGGCVNPVPFDRLGDVDFVIASDVVSLPRGGPQPHAGADADRVRLGGAGAQHDPPGEAPDRPAPDVMINPPTGNFGPMDFAKAEAVIAASEPGKDAIKRQIAEALEAWARGA